MKTKTVATLLSLIALTYSANALSFKLNEDTDTLLDYEVVWGPSPFTPEVLILFDVEFLSFDIIDSEDNITIDRSIPPNLDFDVFRIFFGPADRSLAAATIEDFEGALILPLLDEPYGARFIYRAVTAVPDGGTTILFLGMGFGLLLCWRRCRATLSHE